MFEITKETLETVLKDVGQASIVAFFVEGNLIPHFIVKAEREIHEDTNDVTLWIHLEEM